MTEPDMPDPTPPVPAETPERVRIDSPPAQRQRDFLPFLYLLGFVVLAGALAYLYANPGAPEGVEQAAARVDTLQQQLQSITGRLTALEQRPAPAPAADLAPLERRVATLEQRPSASAAVSQDLAPVSARLDAVAAKQDDDLKKLNGRLDALEARTDAGPLAARLDAAVAKENKDLQSLDSRLGALEARADPGPLAARLDKQGADLQKQGTDLQNLSSRLDTLDTRLTVLDKQNSGLAGQLGGITEHAQRIARIQAASAALDAGQRLGDIPGAPPALAQFAHDNPPTEAALRLSFNNAAEAAQRASQPAIMDNQSFGARMWTRAQEAVTVRQGDRVLVGDPVSGVLAHARQALDVGDLAGALAALKGLNGPAAAAMAGWTSQARALLDARAALTAMAARN